MNYSWESCYLSNLFIVSFCLTCALHKPQKNIYWISRSYTADLWCSRIVVPKITGKHFSQNHSENTGQEQSNKNHFWVELNGTLETELSDWLLQFGWIWNNIFGKRSKLTFSKYLLIISYFLLICNVIFLPKMSSQNNLPRLFYINN